MSTNPNDEVSATPSPPDLLDDRTSLAPPSSTFTAPAEIEMAPARPLAPPSNAGSVMDGDDGGDEESSWSHGASSVTHNTTTGRYRDNPSEDGRSEDGYDDDNSAVQFGIAPPASNWRSHEPVLPMVGRIRNMVLPASSHTKTRCKSLAQNPYFWGSLVVCILFLAALASPKENSAPNSSSSSNSAATTSSTGQMHAYGPGASTLLPSQQCSFFRQAHSSWDAFVAQVASLPQMARCQSTPDATTCACDNIATGSPLATDNHYYPGWQTQHDTNVKLVTAQKDTPVQVVLYGDALTEAWWGTLWGQAKIKYADNVKVYQEYFMTEHGATMNGLALGISGDTGSQLLWRVRNGELPDTLQSNVYWIMVRIL
jgi:hypothetical protein